MSSLPILDLGIIIAYILAMVGMGIYFSRKNNNASQFTTASGSIPGWAIGMSIYATFLSSNTFLGVPGKAFGSNWNAFVFSISMPFAAWVASKYFVSFYRKTGEISAYTHLEKRFGPWARTYAVICFLLTQFARMGSIFFGMALTLHALLGFSMSSIMIIMGVCIILYTVMGGMEAVIWTEVVQGILKTAGALLILFLIIRAMPGGIQQIYTIAKSQDKFSLGTMDLNFNVSGFWVVFLYGFFMNLNNFGMDQNYIQRYHTAATSQQAIRSVWFCVAMYVPASFLFFTIGSALFSYYQVNTELLNSLKYSMALEKLGQHASVTDMNSYMSALTTRDYADKVLPHFLVNKMPTVCLGLIVAAILSAAMSTISSGMNACATVFTKDIYVRYINREASENREFFLLRMTTLVFGLIGLGAGLSMIGIKSILDVWWELSGIFAGGMLGLFLLGLISRQTISAEALIAVVIGVIVICWLSFADRLSAEYAFLKTGLHKNMIMVVSTLTIFMAGLLLSRGKRWASLLMTPKTNNN